MTYIDDYVRSEFYWAIETHELRDELHNSSPEVVYARVRPFIDGSYIVIEHYYWEAESVCEPEETEDFVTDEIVKFIKENFDEALEALRTAYRCVCVAPEVIDSEYTPEKLTRGKAYDMSMALFEKALVNTITAWLAGNARLAA
ncbi:MAG: hypothetical protein LUD47_07820 [Clostridia bacterium]|nr:hypothetical protein [Clostridia bacterium]